MEGRVFESKEEKQIAILNIVMSISEEMVNFLNDINGEPDKITEHSEAYELKIRALLHQWRSIRAMPIDHGFQTGGIVEPTNGEFLKTDDSIVVNPDGTIILKIKKGDEDCEKN
jgi:hypothetical protein